MKTLPINILIFHILLSLSVFAQADTRGHLGEVTYRYYEDSLAFSLYMDSMERVNPEEHAMVEDRLYAVSNVANQLSFVLNFTNTEAVFSLDSEAIPDDDQAVKSLYNDAVALAKGYKIYYTNIADSVKLYEIPLGSPENRGHITEPFDKYNWEITGETKIIGKYTCRKAVASYSKLTYCCGEKDFIVTAWFAPSLPYPYGPMGYDGLPGLVLELATDSTVPTGFIAESIEIKMVEDANIRALGKPIKTMTEAELNDYATARMRRIRRQ